MVSRISPHAGARRILKGTLTSLVAALVTAGFVYAEPSKPPVPEEEIVSRYLGATEQQQSALRGGSMEVDIDSNVPKLKKEGKLHALRSISRLGKITYHALGFIGDNMVKTEVIARFLTEEVKAANQEPSTNTNFAISPANYKFKYKGMESVDGRDVYVLHLTPRQKRVGLFKGELWLDAETYMPVRESGTLVKTPSIFLKKMQFVRVYEMQNGVAVPQHMQSKAEVRFIGPVELNINYLRFSKEADAEPVVSDPK